MCIYFNPKLEDLSEKELEGADQAGVDNEDEEDEEFSDGDNMSAPEEEVAGLSSLNKIMNMLGENEVLEETWSQLCVMKKLEVIDIILKLDLLIEMEDMSEKGKFLAHLGAIFEEKSDGTFKIDVKGGLWKHVEIDNKDEGEKKEHICDTDCRWIEEQLLSFYDLLLITLKFMCRCRSQVLKLKEMVNVTSDLDLMTEMKDMIKDFSEHGKEAMALLRIQFDTWQAFVKEYLKKMEVIRGMENN
eukprot:GFUD01037348.1.p1 GENE.GFUD01037348.1~~GFUD01037348.1.p1  ORF type:complete len:265 (+),score=75.71 GFUD01037348.1:64-795(+)